MYIASAGCAFPETVVSNAFLAELSDQYPASYITDATGIRERRSVLRPEYLRDGANMAVSKAPAGSFESSSDLGARACREALQQAGVTGDQVGLILGDTVTPLQVIPSEAQRIAAKLGLKVTSYDLVASSASLALELQTLLSWKDERVPELAICVSSNAITQRIDYRRGDERLYFGDAAAALVVSKTKGKLRVLRSYYSSDPTRKDLLTIDLASHLSCQPAALLEIARTDEEMFQLALEESGVALPQVRWISARLDPTSLKESARRRGVSSENIWSSAERYGNSAGATLGVTLAARWQWLKPGEIIIATCAGFGYSFGYVVLEVVA